jgi:hypothetical protein
MHRLSLLLALVGLGLTASLASAYPRVPQPMSAVAGNPADGLVAEPIEDSVYDPATTCAPAGNPQALARRMGVEELIWDCGYWGAGMSDFEPYSVCYSERGMLRKHVDKTVAHRDHLHIGMTRAGAQARTSFWR